MPTSSCSRTWLRAAASDRSSIAPTRFATPRRRWPTWASAMPGERSRSPCDEARLRDRQAMGREALPHPFGDDMTSTALRDNAAAQGDLTTDDPQGRGKRFARLFGALFIAGFLFYGIGFGLVSSVTTAPDFMSTLATHSTTLVIGAFLMLVNTVLDIGKGVLFFPIAERRGKRTALVYLAAITAQVVFLDLGVLFLLMLVPMSALAGGASAASAPAFGTLLTGANTLAYEIGQGTLAFGALFMTWFLFRTRYVPRALALLGVVGYAIHLTGAVAEILGVHVGLALSLPAGSFEVALGFWLIAKGFRTVVADRPSRDEAAQPAPAAIAASGVAA